MLRRLIPLLLLCLLLTPPRDTAFAHGYIVRSIPENRASLERAPVRVQYWFSESLEPAFSTITVRDASGAEIASGGVDARDPRLLAARLPVGLPDGAYIVDLRIAFASDGHVIAERRSFFVGQAAADVDEAAQSGAIPLEVIWRALTLAGTMLLFGVYSGYALVFIPAWGSAAHPAGELPPRVMRRIDRLAFAGLALAASGTLIALLQQTMVFFDADLGRVLSEGLWQVVRASTRFGDTWTARALLLLLIAALHAASIYVRREQPSLARPFLTANFWALPPLALTWSVGAHAAGSPVLPWIALFSDWLHGIGVGLWAGGVAALALVLPIALAPYDDAGRRAGALAALRRFAPIAAACFAVVIATGIYNASNWLTKPADLSAPYGLTLILKAALILPLAWLAWLGRSALKSGTPRLTALRLESIVAAGVIAAAAWLSATPVPPLELSGRDIEAPTASAQSGAYQVTVTVSPGGAGVNTYDIALTHGDQPVEGARVRLRLMSPERDVRGAIYDADDIGGGLYTAAGADIDRPGVWWLTADIDGERAAFAFDIDASAAVSETLPPSPINLIALAVMAAAIGFAVYPAARRFVKWLDLSPAAVAVAVGAVAVTIGIAAAGIAAADSAARDYEAALNPPPTVVNPILPDAESLRRGESALDACGWAGASLDELIRRLDRTRDEALYSLIETGWRDLAPCALDENTRWDMVNALRAME
jgi:putative copper export protein/methionine-rich copper-binding protein CopC